MSLISLIKSLLGLAGADSATTSAVGGVAQAVAASAAASAKGEQIDAYSRQRYVQLIARSVNKLDTEEFSGTLRTKDYDRSEDCLETLEEDCRLLMDDMREEEPDEDLDNDMALVEAAAAYAKGLLAILPALKDAVAILRSNGGANTPESAAKFQTFNEKEAALTAEWNNALNSFMAKHNIPAESVL